MEKQAFAEALGVTRNTVGNYEMGKTAPQRPVLRAWASLCDVPFGWLIGDGQQPAGNDGYAELLHSMDLVAA
jgi:transcriptional regulator with XRE-family HTH domain